MSHRIISSFLSVFQSPKVAFVLIGLILLSQGVGMLYRSHLEKNWETIVADEETELAQDLQRKFNLYQRESESEIQSVLNQPALAQYLANDSASSAVSLFELLNWNEKKEVMLEVYDASKLIQGWSGNRGPAIDTLKLQNRKVSYILQGPMYSYYVISFPIFSDKTILGYLVGKRLFEVQYPINNRFINSDYFTSTFTSTLTVIPAFTPLGTDVPERDSTRFSINLIDADGDAIILSSIERPSLQTRTEEVEQFTNQLSGLLGMLGLLMLSSMILHRIRNLIHWLWRLVFLSITIWIFRYILLWLDIPGGFFPETIFDPTYFASPFGFGLAKSLGDIFLTSLFFLVNVLFIVYQIFSETREETSKRVQHSRGTKMVLIVTTLVLTALLLLSMRGFIAIVQSAVVDSSFTYNDPASITPSFELSIMLVSLFFLSFSFVLSGMGIIMLMHTGFRMLAESTNQLRLWGWLTIIVLTSGFLYGMLVPNTLMSQVERVIYESIFLATSFWALNGRERRKPIFSPSTVSVLMLIAICFVVPVLDKKIHESDRTHVELVAHELVRPADSWMNFVMATSLDEIGNNIATETLRSGSDEEIAKLGFTQWARSILSKEGNDCSVTFIDNEGSVVSDFHIGNTPHWYRRHAMDEMPRSTSLLSTGDRTENGKLVKWYRGYRPIYSEDDIFLGGVWVEISGVQRRLQGAAQSEILRNNSARFLDIRNRRLLTFEYFQGKLVQTTAETVPLGIPIPQKEHDNDPQNGFWVKETIDGKTYEMYLLPENVEGSAWIAVGMEVLDMRWYIFSFLRFALFFMVISAVLLAGLVIITKVLGQKSKEGFRAKLLTAFVIVSIIPMLLLAYLNRQYANQRIDEITAQRLSSQTSVVVAEIEKKIGASLPVLVSQLTDEQCDEIAATMGVDFNVFLGEKLQATSKPEMFTSELLDKSLSGSAFLNTILKRKSFYSETQVIGSLPYVVGYRPIFSESGNVMGAVAVPTLFRQQDVNEELTRRNVFLFGAYSLTFILSLIVASIFANGIASPVRRLRQATEQIAQGNLEIEIRKSSTDEIGDLERAFQQMAVELRQKQNQIVKAQRELAWKEMARQVAHEIKNPLTPMKLSVQQLLQAYKDAVPNFGEVLQRVSSTVLEQIDALSRIASEFTNFARMPKQNIERCDVHEIILEATNLYQNAGLQLSTQFDASSSIVMADREELRRVFINIVKNSIQAMKGIGSIQINTLSGKDFIDITMKDSGPGIPKEIQSRLFEMNFSTKTDGMGIGLTIVQATVQNLGGTVNLTSVVGQGTTVHIRLPLENPSLNTTQILQ